VLKLATNRMPIKPHRPGRAPS